VEIRAGVLTPAIWLFALGFYACVSTGGDDSSRATFA
jgi:hypothetical protein